MVIIWCLGQRGQRLVLEIILDMSHQLICKPHDITTEEVGPGKLSVMRSGRKSFDFLYCPEKVELKTENTQLFRLGKDGALRAHNLMKQTVAYYIQGLSSV
jgi:hypothetical protein